LSKCALKDVHVVPHTLCLQLVEDESNVRLSRPRQAPGSVQERQPRARLVEGGSAQLHSSAARLGRESTEGARLLLNVSLLFRFFIFRASPRAHTFDQALSVPQRRVTRPQATAFSSSACPLEASVRSMMLLRFYLHCNSCAASCR